MEYHDQPLQFISSHYFQIKEDSEDDTIYSAVKEIMTTLPILSIAMMLLIGCMTIKHVYPVILGYVDQYSKINKEDLEQSVFSANSNEQMPKLVQLNKKQKKYYLLSLFFTSCVVTVLLVTLHIVSITKFIAYGNKILHNGDANQLRFNIALSCFFIGVMFVIAIVFCTCIRRKSVLIASSISVNIVYVASCFFPSMVLAFIQDPMQVILTCLMAVAAVIFVYAVIRGVVLCALLFWVRHCMPLYPSLLLQTIYKFVVAFLGAPVIFLYFFLILNMFTLGSFSDFKSLQNMLLPLLVVLLSIFIMKPAYKLVCKTLNNNNNIEKIDDVTGNNVDEVHINLDKVDKVDSDIELEEMDGQNYEDTIV